MYVDEQQTSEARHGGRIRAAWQRLGAALALSMSVAHQSVSELGYRWLALIEIVFRARIDEPTASSAASSPVSSPPSSLSAART
jgi:hypothetical protein